MIKKIKFLSVMAVAFFISSVAFSQENYGPEDYYDSQWSISDHKIRKLDLMYKKTLWYRMDVRTKINHPFNARGHELSRMILEAALEGIIRPWKNDSLMTPMKREEFETNLTRPTSSVASEFDEEDDDFDDGPSTNAAPANKFYDFKDLYLVDLREDYLWDRRRSEYYWDIKALTIVLPAANSPTNLEKPIATFSYRDVCNLVFKDNPDAIWYNPANGGEPANNGIGHINFADAFELRLHDATLQKFNNPYDLMLVDMTVGGNFKKALADGEKYEFNITEWENHLWEN